MKKSCLKVNAGSLSGIELFSRLSLEERKVIAQKCSGFRFEPDAIIVSHNDTDNDIYFILSGKVRITIYSTSGKEITFRDQNAGEMFGEIAAIDHKPRSAYVVALKETHIAVMSAGSFMEILQNYPSLTQGALMRLANLVRSLSERVIEFSSLGVKNRIHAELLRLAQVNMDSVNSAMISPAPTHVEIASRISSHREAITRELSQLMSSGLIERNKNKLIIHDVVKLESMVRDVSGK